MPASSKWKVRTPILLASVGRCRKAFSMATPDQLRELFRMQKALNERMGVKTGGMAEGDQGARQWLRLGK
jgi:hypothetical protein